MTHGVKITPLFQSRGNIFFFQIMVSFFCIQILHMQMWIAAALSIIISWTFGCFSEQVNVNTTEFHLFGELGNQEQ